MKKSPLASLLLGAFSICILAIPAHADLVAYYPLGGDFNDASGNGNVGEFIGGTEYTTEVPASIGSGMAIEFDGTANSDDRVFSEGMPPSNDPFFNVGD